METLFEQLGGTYRAEGDYLVPNIIPPCGNYEIGKYGRMRRQFLKEHRATLYSVMIVDGSLYRHLAEVNQTCHERLDRIQAEMARRENVDDALKAADQMEWVRRMNSIHNRAEEIVLHELVFDAESMEGEAF